FERIMINRGDFEIFHEPFAYVYYVLEQKAPATGMIIDLEHPKKFDDIKKNILNSAGIKPIFLKDMAYHCYKYIVKDELFLKKLVNTFIIRNPAKSIPSYYFLDPNIIEDEIGYQQQYHLFQKIAALSGQIPVVIDADDLQSHPKEIFASYCKRINIEFIPEALQWRPSYDKKWDIWKNWHADVASSSKIYRRTVNYYEENMINNGRIRELYEYSLPFYEQMYQYRVVPDSTKILNK
ncbi:MAG: hypothetical protein AAFW70_07080, partial [Cyanobacteria bacterium J06635_10]